MQLHKKLDISTTMLIKYKYSYFDTKKTTYGGLNTKFVAHPNTPSISGLTI